MSSEYSGMTVNERLYVSGYLKDFDSAIYTKNSNKLNSILRKIEVDEKSMTLILKKYGLE